MSVLEDRVEGEVGVVGLDPPESIGLSKRA
jgi:hypothetical protein